MDPCQLEPYDMYHRNIVEYEARVREQARQHPAPNPTPGGWTAYDDGPAWATAWSARCVEVQQQEERAQEAGVRLGGVVLEGQQPGMA